MNLQRGTKRKEFSTPFFPPRKWIKNKEKQFLDHRIDQLQVYFNNILHNDKYFEILDLSSLKDLFYTLIWSELKLNNKKILSEIHQNENFSSYVNF